MAERQGQVFTKVEMTHRPLGSWTPKNQKEEFGDLDVRQMNKDSSNGIETILDSMDSVKAHEVLALGLSRLNWHLNNSGK